MPSIGWTKVEQHPFSMCNSPVEGCANDAVFLVKAEQGGFLTMMRTAQLTSRIYSSTVRGGTGHKDHQHPRISRWTLWCFSRRHPLPHHPRYRRRDGHNPYPLSCDPPSRPCIDPSVTTTPPSYSLEHTSRLSYRMDHSTPQRPFCKSPLRQAIASDDRHPRDPRECLE